MKEKALILEQDPLLQSVLDCFDEGICLLDEAGAVAGMNEAAEQLTGYRAEELAGRSLSVCMDTDKLICPDSSRLRHALLRRRDGRRVEVTISSYCLDGAGAGALVKLRPCDVERRPSLSLGGMEQKLQDLFDVIPDGVILIDERGSIQLFNAGAERLFGYGREEAIGKNVKLLMPSPNREAHDNYLSNYLRTGVRKIIGIGREVEARRKDGSIFPIYLSIGELELDGRRLFVGVTHDLSNRKRVEQKLLTVSSAVDQSPNAVLISDKDGVIEYVNESFARLTGYEASELIGQNPRLLRSDRTSRDEYGNLWRTIIEGRAWRGEIEDRRKDGTLYWAKETIAPLRNARGEITHYLAIQEDVTELKREKEALIKSEERFRQVARMTGEWIWEQDPSGCYTYSSGAVYDILGFTPDEILGKNYRDLQCGRSEESEPPIRSSQQSSAFFRLVNQYCHKDGGVVFTESSGAPILDEKGEIICWRGVDHDITAHKAFEDALRLRNRAMNSVHVGIAISDAQIPGNPNIYVNPGLCAITGYSREELLGKNTSILRGPETDIAAIEQIRQALAAGRDYEVTLRSYRKGGVPFWNEILVSAVYNEKGALTHYVEIHTDVTERRKAEESRHELEIAKHIQLSLLPDAALRLPTVEVAGVCAPASLVGGDYFDFFANSGTVDVIIADVSGHSVGAALMMTELRSALRVEARKGRFAEIAPGRSLTELNSLLYEDLNRVESFITMFYVKFRSDSRILKYANAGHNRALLLQAGRAECSLLDADGLVLGVWREVYFEEKSIELLADDILLLYTDGVTDARDAQGEFFGLDRLCASLKTRRDLPPENLVNGLLEDVRAFCGGQPLDDDVAIVAMRVR